MAITNDWMQSARAHANRGDLPVGVPIPWTGKRNRRKHHGRGKGNMMGTRFYEVAPSRYCCYGHDHVKVVTGAARQREKVVWLADYRREQESEYDTNTVYDWNESGF